jgi:hypothetical protein
MRHLACRHIGEVLRRKGLQRKASLPRRDRQSFLFAVDLDFHFRTIGKLAHDVVQDDCGDCHRASSSDVRAHTLHNLALQIRRLERQLLVPCPEQHVRQDRNGRAPLDDARDMTERPEKLTSFDH